MVYFVLGRNPFVLEGSQTISLEQMLARFVWFPCYTVAGSFNCLYAKIVSVGTATKYIF